MEAQEVFDKVVTHLRTQGCQAFDPDNGCVYRGPNGTKCAVGCLIPDKEYTPQMEGQNVSAFVIGKFFDVSDNLSKLIKNHYDLLVELQRAHDDRRAWFKNEDGISLEIYFKTIAFKHSLIYTPPK